jgi:environmental stress-induced protein Ves
VNLNVMHRRERTAAEVAVVRGTLRLQAPEGGTVLAVALEDGAALDGQDIELDCYDAVLMEGTAPAVLRTQGWSLVITLSPAGGQGYAASGTR